MHKQLYVKAALPTVQFFSGKYCIWKLKKDFDLSLDSMVCNLKQTPLILKKIPLEYS